MRGKLIVAAIVAVCAGLSLIPAQSKEPETTTINVPDLLQEVCVTIRADQAEGSGVIRVTNDGTTWVWTCGHVIEHLRRVRKIITDNGEKTVVEFGKPKIIKLIIEEGETVGRVEIDTDVVRYSDAVHGEDLALLRVRKKNFTKSSIEFYLDEKIPPLGTELYHCASPLGQFGANTLTAGIISQHGRMMGKTVFDQATVLAHPGCSGGAIVLKSDGRYVGCLVRGAGEGFNLMVPIRRMRSWAKKVGVDFTIDNSLPVTPLEKVLSAPVEDNGVSDRGDDPAQGRTRKMVLLRQPE